jgi:hypothetical protein
MMERIDVERVSDNVYVTMSELVVFGFVKRWWNANTTNNK